MMPKRRPLVILRKVSSLLKRSFNIAKSSTKPIIPRLILLKRSRKASGPKSYQYQLLLDCEFSPSSTPPTFYPLRGLNRRRFRDICDPLSYLCGCLGKATKSAAMDIDYGPLALPPAVGDASLEGVVSESPYKEEDSVDERAERFIEKFYEEMRMQRRESL